MTLLRTSTDISSISGKSGGSVFRHDRFGQHVSALRRSVRRSPTDTQLNRRNKFKSAAAYILSNVTPADIDYWQSYANQHPITNRLGEKKIMTWWQAYLGHLLLTEVPMATGGTATFVVAASNASASEKQRADYVCDGVADDVEINAALSAVDGANGGRVFLSPGDFTLSDTILINDNTTLVGAGASTKLTFAVAVGDVTMFTNGCGYTPGSRHGTGNFNITICDMLIDGDKDNRSTGTDYTWTVGFNTVENLIVCGLQIENGWTAALRTEFCTNVWIFDNKITNPGDDCIAINEETFYCQCYSNYCSDSGGGGKSYGAACGIEVQDGSHDVCVFGNTVLNSLADGIEISTHSGKGACYNVSVFSNSVSSSTECELSLTGISGTECYNITVSSNILEHVTAVSHYCIFADYITDCVVFGNACRSPIQNVRFMDTITRVNISNNTFSCSASYPTALVGVEFNGTVLNSRFDGNIIDNYGWIGLRLYGTLTNMHVVNNHIVRCDHGSGVCVRWESPTSSLCVLNGNHLQGTHWSYDAATTTYNVLAANWTETWNTKDT